MGYGGAGGGPTVTQVPKGSLNGGNIVNRQSSSLLEGANSFNIGDLGGTANLTISGQTGVAGYGIVVDDAGNSKFTVDSNNTFDQTGGANATFVANNKPGASNVTQPFTWIRWEIGGAVSWVPAFAD